MTVAAPAVADTAFPIAIVSPVPARINIDPEEAVTTKMIVVPVVGAVGRVAVAAAVMKYPLSAAALKLVALLDHTKPDPLIASVTAPVSATPETPLAVNGAVAVMELTTSIWSAAEIIPACDLKFYLHR